MSVIGTLRLRLYLRIILASCRLEVCPRARALGRAVTMGNKKLGPLGRAFCALNACRSTSFYRKACFLSYCKSRAKGCLAL